MVAAECMVSDLTENYPDFVHCQLADRTKQRIYFVKSINFLADDQLYSTFMQHISGIDSNKDVANLLDHVTWKTEVAHIGETSITSFHRCYLKDAMKPFVSMCITSVNIQNGRPTKFSNDLKHEFKPTVAIPKRADLFIDPPRTVKLATFRNIVPKTAIDQNNHCNYSFYIAISLRNIEQFNRDFGNGNDYHYKEFLITYKAEVLLGEVITSTVWQRENGDICCKMAKSEKLVAFVETSSFKPKSLCNL